MPARSSSNSPKRVWNLSVRFGPAPMCNKSRKPFKPVRVLPLATDDALEDRARRDEVRRRVLGIVGVRARPRGEVDELKAKLGRPGGDVSVPVLVRRQEIARPVDPEASDLLQVGAQIGGESLLRNQGLLALIPRRNRAGVYRNAGPGSGLRATIRRTSGWNRGFTRKSPVRKKDALAPMLRQLVEDRLRRLRQTRVP